MEQEEDIVNKDIYYKKCQESQVYLVGDQNIHSGADEKNFDISPENKILLATSNLYYLEEYQYFGDDSGYMKIRSKVFEKTTKFTQMFKSYHVFVLYEENLSTLCVYDPNNNIFVKTFNENNNRKMTQSFDRNARTTGLTIFKKTINPKLPLIMGGFNHEKDSVIKHIRTGSKEMGENYNPYNFIVPHVNRTKRNYVGGLFHC